jgi:hypothetical protein
VVLRMSALRESGGNVVDDSSPAPRLSRHLTTISNPTPNGRR